MQRLLGLHRIVGTEIGMFFIYKVRCKHTNMICTQSANNVCCLFMCILHQSYFTITAGTANCPMLGGGLEGGSRKLVSLPGDGFLRTRGLHLQHGSNSLSSTPN